jgi:hypothetical protein
MVDGARGAYRRLAMLVTRLNGLLTTALGELGPYAAVALLLPGGTLIVASLWIAQRRPGSFPHVRRGLAIALAVVPALVLSGSTLLPGSLSTPMR